MKWLERYVLNKLVKIQTHLNLNEQLHIQPHTIFNEPCLMVNYFLALDEEENLKKLIKTLRSFYIVYILYVVHIFQTNFFNTLIQKNSLKCIEVKMLKSQFCSSWKW